MMNAQLFTVAMKIIAKEWKQMCTREIDLFFKVQYIYTLLWKNHKLQKQQIANLKEKFI